MNGGHVYRGVGRATAHDVARQLRISRGKRVIAEKKGQLCDEIIATVLQRCRAQQQHSRAIAERGYRAVTLRARVPQVMRLVDDDELGIAHGARYATTQTLQRDERSLDPGQRRRSPPAVTERCRSNDENTLKRVGDGEGDEGLAQAGRVREHCATVGAQQREDSRRRASLMCMKRDLSNSCGTRFRIQHFPRDDHSRPGEHEPRIE